MSTAVVTGGAGFLGSHLCEYLLDRDWRVICLDNLDTGSLENIERLRGAAFDFRYHNCVEFIDLYLAAIEQGVAFVPGDVFFAGPAPRPHLRLCFATQSPTVIGEAIQILGQVLSTQLARRSFMAPTRADYVPLV